MFKEIVISIIIVIVIFSLDLVTQNYTKETTNLTSERLTNLKEEIKKGESKITNTINQIYKDWEDRRKKLAYFIEHDELEKVETNLTNIRAFIEAEELDMAINEIDEAKFILEHIKEKTSFSLENIF